jgi:hypothetical protein
MNKQSREEVIARWRKRRELVDGKCLFAADKATKILRELRPLESRYFLHGEVPTYRAVCRDDKA